MGATPSKSSSSSQHDKDLPHAVCCTETETFDIINPTDGYSIPCKLWKPSNNYDNNNTTKKRPPRAAVFFIHGGVFTLGDRETHGELIQAFVKQLNVVIVTASFRDGKTTTYSTGETMSDLIAVADFMLNDDNNNNLYNTQQKLPFGLIGCSSGGYFAMALANHFDETKAAANGKDVNESLKFCIPICPVSNPHARAMYLRHCLEDTTPLGTGKELYSVRHTPERAQEILNLQLQFFETYKQMAVAAHAVDRNIHDVPTLVVLGAEDKNVPPQVTEHVSSRWCWRLIVVGKGAGHEIQAVPPSDPRLSYIPDMNTFLASVLHEGDNDGDRESRRPWCS